MTGSAHRTLRRRVKRGFLAVVAVLVVLVAMVATALVVFIRAGDDVIYRWQPAVTASQNLLADLVNQETGVRGYALGRETSFLQPYLTHRTEQAEDYAELRRLIPAGDSKIRGDLDAFNSAVSAWRTGVADAIIAKVKTSDGTAFAVANSRRAKAAFDEIRARGATLTADLAAKQQAAINRRFRAIVFVWIAVVVTAALVVLAGLLVWRGLQRSVLWPLDALGERTRTVAGGNLTHAIAAEGPPEIAQLGTDVELMRARIVDELDEVEQARIALVARSEDLARSNADLEQFAYIASHDLSEPLRKVANFCQLLERQYAPQLDDKARLYIGFAVDGAKRMQLLIADLLAFSRVGRTSDEFEDVDTGDSLDRAVANLGDRITGSDAVIVHAEMPTVRGDPTLLTALFQNLVGNSIKYRGEDVSRVEISASRSDDAWLFTIADNGIGIEPKYADRIFAIFQRLHLRDQYGGTGIGLALCRKIVEFHGGRIWLVPSQPPGATFQFTLPDRR